MEAALGFVGHKFMTTNVSETDGCFGVHRVAEDGHCCCYQTAVDYEDIENDKRMVMTW